MEGVPVVLNQTMQFMTKTTLLPYFRRVVAINTNLVGIDSSGVIITITVMQ